MRKELNSELVVVGGGISGICASITAARAGLQVCLVQDRPVLGGNSSSEVRLWILGATSHMGNNNRWAREGGVIDEILVENMYRNKEGNPLIFDSILLDKVKAEDNIVLLLNTVIHDLEKSNANTISSVRGFCSQNSTEYVLSAPLFCDASGDGILGFLAGAAFRMGAEGREEFGEKFAPTKEYGELLGHSLYFYSKDIGKPVKFTPPDFALADITKIPRFRNFNTKEFGCQLWWIEYGGRMDTVHDTEEIKWELWKVVYGVWNYIKNSGKFPEAETLTLEWVGAIPGKRESRRFEGDYMIRQQDIVEQRSHEDAVAFGGWSIDLHPADGIFSEKPGCNQWHSKGIYQIPYRSLYSKNLSNLFLAGRIISATHVAFASTRVMATAAHVGQAVGMAAKIAYSRGVSLKDLAEGDALIALQQGLLKTGHHIPGLQLQPTDLLSAAQISASSTYQLEQLSADKLQAMEWSMAQMVPLVKGKVPQISFAIEAGRETMLDIELRVSSKPGNFSPDLTLAEQCFSVAEGHNNITVDFGCELVDDAYAFIVFKHNPHIKFYYSEQRITGVLSVFNAVNKAVSNLGKQTPSTDIGVEEFEFWCPQRRPAGQNIALSFNPPLTAFESENIRTGIYRPTTRVNAWVAAIEDEKPQLSVIWPNLQEISHIDFMFDTDADHPMESVLMGHPENVMPFCIRNFNITDEGGNVLYSKADNYQTRVCVKFEKRVHTKKLNFNLEHPSAQTPAALFGLRCY